MNNAAATAGVLVMEEAVAEDGDDVGILEALACRTVCAGAR